MAADKKPQTSQTPKLSAEEKLRAAEIHQHEQLLLAAQRIVRAKKAQTDLIEFARLTMPSPANPDDSDESIYKEALHHQCLAAGLQEVAKGNIMRLIVTMPPRHGKTELCSKKMIPWFIGKDPSQSTIFATYNQDYADDIGRSVRGIMRLPVYKQIFPNAHLLKGATASDRIETTMGGLMVFAGQGGPLTGRGAHLLLIDDPVKGVDDSESKSARDKLWQWFTKVAMSRLMDMSCRVVIVMTRWHEDDIVGRLTNPKSEHYDEEEAKKWQVLSLPALAVKGDPMGREPGEALWPERFSVEFLESARRMDPKGFSALYQGNPTPEDGNFFKREWIKTYRPQELPKNLRKYVASDHAVSTAQGSDSTVLLPIGVCENDIIWILPDVWWKRADTDDVVDAMLDIMKRHKPLMWWAERGHISKSIGPFLRKRMVEEGAYCAIDEVVPAKNKETRAQSIRGRMSMGMVRFPSFAPWYADALDEVLKFSGGTHDDFVDALAYIGMGLGTQVSASAPFVQKTNDPKPGTLAWVKYQSKYEDRQRQKAHADGY